MLGLNKPCLTCGELTTNESRCDPHQAEMQARMKAKFEKTRVRPSNYERGLDGAWKRLSIRARKLQGYCSDCGTTENLTADHLPVAWYTRLILRRYVTLAMVDVVCGKCNTKRGSSRPGEPRYVKWAQEQGIQP